MIDTPKPKNLEFAEIKTDPEIPEALPVVTRKRRGLGGRDRHEQAKS